MISRVDYDGVDLPILDVGRAEVNTYILKITTLHKNGFLVSYFFLVQKCSTAIGNFPLTFSNNIFRTLLVIRFKMFILKDDLKHIMATYSRIIINIVCLAE